jgi:hypothetical protein
VLGLKSKDKKKKKKIEGECYFCKQELNTVDRVDKIKLGCCDVVSHKKELYQWFLKNQHCPSCLAVHKQERTRLLNWGMKLESPERKHQKTGSLEKRKRSIPYEKRLREQKK